jgi:predicted nucleic acid-binding protein
MTVYLDTSVILPALLQRHENYLPCRDLLQHHLREGDQLVTAAHTCGELYRHLTRNVPPFELSPPLADDAILNKLLQIIGFVEVGLAVYRSAIQRCANLEYRGAIIYDALHLELALSEGATTVYTDNTKDFNRLLTKDDELQIAGVR